MALSASFDSVVTRDDIIAAALRKLGVLAEGQSPSSNQTTYAAQALNLMMQSLAADGLPLWYIKTGYIYPTTGTNEISLASSGGGHFTGELILTKTTAAASSGATALTVSITAADDVTGTTADSDIIGVEQDDGTVHWTTIASGGGTASLTLTDALTAAAASGNRVYAYTAKAQRPEAVLDVYRVTASSGARVKIDPTPISQLQGISSQLTASTPTTWAYIETLTTGVPGTDAGTFRFWPRWDGADDYLEIRYQSPFDDVDSSTHNIAFPRAWHEAIVYGLALRLTDEYQVPDNVYKRIAQAAETLRERAETATTEKASIYVYPEMR
jgi:hypothetical protein